MEIGIGGGGVCGNGNWEVHALEYCENQDTTGDWVHPPSNNQNTGVVMGYRGTGMGKMGNGVDTGHLKNDLLLQEITAIIVRTL
jgi:hypothetical protein